ncbi:hypothetical protein JCM10207_003844 [Rhodosporidiobolus poonsookiae]
MFDWNSANVRGKCLTSPPPLPNDTSLSSGPLQQVHRALSRPVPTSFPTLHDKRFCVVLSGTDSEVKALDEAFRSTYHPERLEYFGDKLWEEVVGEAIFLLAPIERMSENGGEPNLGKLGCEVARQVTNDKGEELAVRLGIKGRPTGKGDRGESHLAALYFSNGREALVDFLVPLVKKQFYKQYPELAKMQNQEIREVEATPPVKAKPTPSVQKQPSATPSKPAKPPVQLVKAAGQKLGSSAAKALRKEEKLKAMAFPSLEAAAQDLLEHLQSLNRTYSFRHSDTNLVLRLPGYPAIIAQASKKEPVSLVKLVEKCKKKGAIVLRK